MKAFPHQFNNLEKLTAALELIDLMARDGKDVSDDEELGRELAMSGIYTFRNLTTSVKERLKEESKKPTANQGFRTAARDLRRFFTLAVLIDGKSLKLTPRGTELLKSKSAKPLRNALWREAMLDLQLGEGTGNASHPYRILLKLVGDNPGIDTKKLLLAFEARNDSVEEYARILDLAQKPYDKIVKKMGVSDSSAANAVKILPSIAEQVGDIRRKQKSFLTAVGSSASEDGISEREDNVKEITEVSPENISKIPDFSKKPGGETFDLSAAIEIRKKRTVKHHQAVVSLAKLFSHHGFKVYENPFDCLGHKGGVGAILAEIKTLDATAPDERKQSIKALGQLKSYCHFDVPNELKQENVSELAAFDQTPHRSTIGFLKENAVSSAWLNDDQWFTIDAHGSTVLLSPPALLGFP